MSRQLTLSTDGEHVVVMEHGINGAEPICTLVWPQEPLREAIEHVVGLLGLTLVRVVGEPSGTVNGWDIVVEVA